MSSWVKASDQLPDSSRNVIICLLGIVVFVGHYNAGKKKWRMGSDNSDRRDGGIVAVTHWQELPDPPLKEEA